ncbi:MAG: carboxypeptidase regulatory-like domain-containing protein [Acidobacteriaceae bacterium]
MYRRTKQTLLLIAFLAFGFSALAQVTAPDFSVVVLPDTQFYAQSYPQIFNQQTQWIVNNQANYNIQFVLGEGDVVNTAEQAVQWQSADAAVKLLDNANIPYVMAIGNHDYGNEDPSTRDSSAFNSYFGPARYAQYSWYMGGYPSGTNDNFYTVFTVNGQQYLILALEFVPQDATLVWAKSVLDANPDKEIIVLLHTFTFTDATRADQCDNDDIPATGNNQGEDVWQKLLINYPNLSLVLNGHSFAGANAARRADLGLQQNLVNQILADYQNLANGGDGWMRIMTFRPLLNRIDVTTYSPYLNQYMTDSNDQFSITWHSTGVTSGTGAIVGEVYGGNAAPAPYTCVPIVGATVTASGANATATSDTTGSFSLSVPSGNYTLSATAPGWSTSATDQEAAYPGYPSDAKFFLSPLLGNVAGTVTNSSGNPLSGVAIALSGGTLPTQINVTTNATGSYTSPSISVGNYTVTASATGLTTTTATTNVAQGATTTLNIQLSAPTGGTCMGSTVNRTVTICAPANNATVTSPVSIIAQATDSIAVADSQIYIDRVKQYQIAGSSVNTSLPLAAGTHRVGVLAQDSAGTFESVVNMTVSSSTGTGGSCTGSGGNRTVTICSPANNATVTSPVSIMAQATDSATVADTQVYIDRVEQYQVAGSSVNTSLSLTAGTHRLSVLAQDSAGTFESTINVTVSSTSGGCAAPTSPGVQICQPVSGATVSSPVAIQAAANVTGTFMRMEVWIDGVKKYSEATSTALSTTLTLTAGTHRFAVLAYNTAGTKWEQAYNATVN